MCAFVGSFIYLVELEMHGTQGYKLLFHSLLGAATLKNSLAVLKLNE
jgi:hypothetical protein